jgi:hypothetical protein
MQISYGWRAISANIGVLSTICSLEKTVWQSQAERPVTVFFSGDQGTQQQTTKAITRVSTTWVCYDQR